MFYYNVNLEYIKGLKILPKYYFNYHTYDSKGQTHRKSSICQFYSTLKA